MDAELLIIALAIFASFILFTIGVSWGRQQKQKQQLNQLLIRIGINHSEQKTIQEQLLSQAEKTWYLWLSSKFKKAGITQKQEVIKVIIAQAVLIFLSLFLLIANLHDLSGKVILAIILLVSLPSIFLMVKINKRQTELRQRFPEMLDSIVRSLQSGYGIDGAISAVGEDMEGALAQEMKEVNKQLVLGISMRDILREFQRRVDLPEAQFFVITLIIQRETGGQLSSILSELSKLMRRRENFQAKLKTLTAESRFTAWFIGGAPVGYLGYKYFFDYPSMTFFIEDPLGNQLLWVSIILIALGMIILRQMLKMRF